MKNTLYRNIKLDRAKVDEKERTISITFSSEFPVLRSFGYEILDHGKDSADLSRLNDGAPLLLNHGNDQAGVVEKARIKDDRRGHALVRFGRSDFAEEIFQDVLDGIRQNISFAYDVGSMILEEEKEGEPDVYRVNRWAPYEISIVTIPADNTVGISRQLERDFELSNLLKTEEQETWKKKIKKKVKITLT